MENEKSAWHDFGSDKGHNGMIPVGNGGSVNTAMLFFPDTGVEGAVVINSPPDAIAAIVPAYEAARFSR